MTSLDSTDLAMAPFCPYRIICLAVALLALGFASNGKSYTIPAPTNFTNEDHGIHQISFEPRNEHKNQNLPKNGTGHGNSADNTDKLLKFCGICRFNASTYNQLCNDCTTRQTGTGLTFGLLDNLDTETIQLVLNDLVEGTKGQKWEIGWMCCRASTTATTASNADKTHPNSNGSKTQEFCSNNAQDKRGWALELSKVIQNTDSNSSSILCSEPLKSLDTHIDNPPDSGRPLDLLLICLTATSIILLATTITIYLCLPPLLNIHGKVIVVHLICLMIAYCFQMGEYFHQPIDKSGAIEGNTGNVSTGSGKLAADDHDDIRVCFGIGLGLYGFSFTAFLWLCIVNFDIFSTFIIDTGKARASKSEAMSKFKRYCIFGFGLPILFTALVWILEAVLETDNDIKPNIGDTRCFLSSSRTLPLFLYYYGPIAILLVINFVMFTWTSTKIWKLQSEAEKMKSNSKSKSKTAMLLQRMFLFFKLFCVMGTTWTINIALWASGNHHEVSTLNKHGAARFFECFNVFHGFCYFIVFVCKPSVLRMLHMKCCTMPVTYDTTTQSQSQSRYGTRRNMTTRTTAGTVVSKSNSSQGDRTRFQGDDANF